MQIDTGTMPCPEADPVSYCPVCQQISRMTLSLDMEQTAADYVYDAHAPCISD